MRMQSNWCFSALLFSWAPFVCEHCSRFCRTQRIPAHTGNHRGVGASNFSTGEFSQLWMTLESTPLLRFDAKREGVYY